MWNVKLQQLGPGDVYIRPAHPRRGVDAGLALEEYTLSGSSGASEIMLLRDNDSIYAPGTSSCLKLVWYEPEVQVNSSLTAETNPHLTVDGEESDTEDDDDLDLTIMVQTNPHATPAASIARTDIVQETPQAMRVTLPAAQPEADENGDTPDSGVASSPKQGSLPDEIKVASMPAPTEASDDAPDNEAHQTAESVAEDAPEPRLSRRKLPAATQVTPKVGGKRKKTGDEELSGKKPLTSQKRARLPLHDQSSPRTRGASQASQASGDGESLVLLEPKVAFTNSEIPNKPSTIKFLKQQRGTTVSTVKARDCNIIWYVYSVIVYYI